MKNFYPELPELPFQKTTVLMPLVINSGIYKITSPVGDVYIGKTRDFKRRIWYYKKNHVKLQRKVHQSLNEYGYNLHSFEIIHHLPIDSSEDVYDAYEELYIDLYQSAGFNLLNIRGGCRRGKFPKESREKMSASAKKRPLTEARLSILRYYAKNRSEETRRKVSEAQKGNKHRLGIPHTKETLYTISQAVRLYNYEIIDKHGNHFFTDCLQSFCKERNLTPQLLGHTFRGHYANGDVCNHHKGYKIINKTKKNNERAA